MDYYFNFRMGFRLPVGWNRDTLVGTEASDDPQIRWPFEYSSSQLHHCSNATNCTFRRFIAADKPKVAQSPIPCETFEGKRLCVWCYRGLIRERREQQAQTPQTQKWKRFFSWLCGDSNGLNAICVMFSLYISKMWVLLVCFQHLLCVFFRHLNRVCDCAANVCVMCWEIFFGTLMYIEHGTCNVKMETWYRLPDEDRN